jgi:hypothetical protein
MASSLEVKQIWVAHGDNDGGIGLGSALGYYSSEYEALKAAKGKGYWGGDGVASSRYAIFHGDDVWLLANKNPIDLDGTKATNDALLRADIIKSLSSEQLRVLGIKADS